MIILSSTTDSIKVKLAGNVASSQLECFACYKTTTSTTITPGRNVVVTNNTTAVTLVASPASSNQRVVDYMSVFNNDTNTAIVTIFFDDNGTTYELGYASLLTGEKIEYVEGRGFTIFNSYGGIKRSIVGESNTVTGWGSNLLGIDVVNNNALANTMADVSALGVQLTISKTYWFQFNIPYTSAASTTGCRFSINADVGTNFLYFFSKYSLSTTTQTINHGLSAFDTPAASNASTPTTLVGFAQVEGILQAAASGNLVARFASEVSNSAITAKAGAVVYFKQLD